MAVSKLDKIKYSCAKCGKEMGEEQFYTKKDGSKTDLCKKCLTLHVNNFEPDTYLWILKDMDVPYVPEEWNRIRDAAFAKDPYKMNGTTVLGKYLAKMRLVQFKNKTWADGEKIAAERAKKKREEEEAQREFDEDMKRRFEKGEITESQYKTLVDTSKQYEEMRQSPPKAPIGQNNAFNEANFIDADSLPDPAKDLTEEDKIYLAMKWGRLYQPNEWIELERKYNEMIESFDIHDSDTIGTLILICKTYIKMNFALDAGDVDGYQKLSRVYDSLRKSANFTAAQNKKEKEDFVDSVGNLVAYCEKNGHQIPKFDINEDLDIVDKVIRDMKDYTKSLIYEDTALARQIEEYLEQRKIAERIKQDKKEAKAKGLLDVPIEDKDYQEHFEMLQNEKLKNEDIFQEGSAL